MAPPPPPVGGVIPPQPRVGKGGKGDRGRGQGGRHGSEPPPNATADGMPPAKTAYQTTYARVASQGTDRKVIPAPDGSKGHPWAAMGCTWASPAGPNDWQAACVDQQECKRLAAYPLLKPLLAQCWPANDTLTVAADFDTMMTGGRSGEGFPKDHCKYCYYRGRAPKNEDASHWWWGTGDGAHDVPTCGRFKRFIAEGGDSRDNPKVSEMLSKGGLRFTRSYEEKNKPSGN